MAAILSDLSRDLFQIFLPFCIQAISLSTVRSNQVNLIWKNFYIDRGTFKASFSVGEYILHLGIPKTEIYSEDINF